MMTTQDLILQEMEALPELILAELLIFLRFLKTRQAQECFGAVLLSESIFQKDWLKPEEDEAWQHL
jgi:hypothetical protein